jgi:hypothetical protein
VRPFAHEASVRLVEQGRLRAGDELRWVVSAFAVEGDTVDEPGSATSRAAGFAVEEVVEPLELGATSLAAFFGRAHVAGEPGSELPVFVPRHVLDEVEALSRRAGEVETGGVLIGRLHRDTDAGARGDLFIEVTAQLPAEHAVSHATRLTFTPATWAAASAALALRNLHEIVTGWWHRHPPFCRLRGCPPERQRGCALSRAFFSSEDVHLHATCFGAAHHIALLHSDGVSDGRTWTLYGWSRGMVAERGFHVLTPSLEGANDVQTRTG